MKISDILDISLEDFAKLTKPELRKLTQTLADAANKRINRLKKDEDISEYSPALRAIEKSGGKISTKGKDMHGLQKEFIRASNFLKAKTSTKKGFEQVQQEFTERVSKGYGYRLSYDESKKFWTTYNKYMEEHPTELKKNGGRGSQRAQENIYNMMFQKGITESDIILEKMSKLYEDRYLKEQKEDQESINQYGGRFWKIDMNVDE